jgi:hypothetical protein
VAAGRVEADQWVADQVVEGRVAVQWVAVQWVEDRAEAGREVEQGEIGRR